MNIHGTMENNSSFLTMICQQIVKFQQEGNSGVTLLQCECITLRLEFTSMQLSTGY